MKNKLFDDHIKEQLAGLSPQVPPHIWENIVAEKGRKKPVGFWGLFTGLNMAAAILLVIVAGSLLYFFTRNNESAAQPDQTIVSHTTLPSEKNAINVPGADNTPAQRGNKNIAANNTNTTGQFVPDAMISPPVPAMNLNAPGKQIFTIHEPEQKEAHTNTDNTDTYSIAENELNLRNHFSFAELLKSNGLLNPGVRMPLMPRNLFIPCPKAERDAAGNKKYIEVYGSSDYSFRSISDTSNSYAQQRKSTVKSALGYSAGVRYTKVFKNGMSFRTGINYSQINETFTYVQGHITRNVYITDNAGDTTGTYSVSGTQYQKSTNKFRSIDIPLMAGYEAGNGRLHTDLNAGVMVNLSSRETGSVIDKNGDPVDITTGKQKSVYQFKTNTGISLAAAVSVYYKLNDRLHVLAEPYFRYGLSPVTQSDLSLKQKYHTAGLRLGLRMDL
jgi:hypothetical protein